MRKEIQYLIYLLRIYNFQGAKPQLKLRNSIFGSNALSTSLDFFILMMTSKERDKVQCK